MRIIIVQNGFHEREFLVRDLTKAFPSVIITEFNTAGDFLLAIGTLKSANVIITEHHLPLGEVMRDAEAWFANLSSLFPEVTAEWNHQQAGERLVRHMRKIGMNTPVIIHTYSDEEYIAQDVMKDPKVQYCLKNASARNLISCIKKSVSISV